MKIDGAKEYATDFFLRAEYAGAPSEVPAELMLASGEAIELLGAEGEGENQLRRFKMLAYTGGQMVITGLYLPVVVDLTGLKVDAKSRPILRDHRPSQIVGHTTAIHVGPQRIDVEGVISAANQHAREIQQSAGNGFPWQASIGARATRMIRVDEGEKVTVNGRTFTGPLLVARQAALKEISFVALGADDHTSARIAADAAAPKVRILDMGFDAWLQAQGFDPESLTDQQRTSLRAAFDRERRGALGTALTAAIASFCQQHNRTQEDLVAELGRQARLEAGRIDEILAGHVDGVTREHITAFAQVLQLDPSKLVRAAMQDGVTVGNPPGNGGGNNPPNHNPGGGNPGGNPIVDMRAQAAAEAERIAGIRTLCTHHTAVPSITTIEAQAIREGWDMTRTELEVLRAARPQAPAAHTGRSSDVPAGAIEAALCLAVGLSEESASRNVSEQDMNRATSRELRAMCLHDLMDRVIRASGQWYSGSRRSNDFIRAAFTAERTINASAGGFTSLSLSGILGNVANKALVQAYEAQETVHPKICAVRSHSNFHTHTRYRLDSSGAFQKVGKDGELKHVGLDESNFTLGLDTAGAMIALTRQDMINDDLGAFMQIPTLLGRMSAVRKEEEVFELILANTGNFWHADNNNFFDGADSALSIDSLTEGEQLFLDQVDSNGKPILIMPKILLVPTTLKVTAQDLMTETKVEVTTTANKRQVASNPHAGKFESVVSPYLNNANITNSAGAALSGTSGTAWYLFADPAVRAAIVIATLNGQMMPIIESAETSFDTLGMQWRAYHDFGVGFEDPVASVKSKGAV